MIDWLGDKAAGDRRVYIQVQKKANWGCAAQCAPQRWGGHIARPIQAFISASCWTTRFRPDVLAA